MVLLQYKNKFIANLNLKQKQEQAASQQQQQWQQFSHKNAPILGCSDFNRESREIVITRGN
jgi:hypothetical protein